MKKVGVIYIKKAWFTLCFFLIGLTAQGQADSLLQLLNNQQDTTEVNIRLALFEAYMGNNFDEAKAQLDTTSQLSCLKDFPKGLAKLKKYYGEYYIRKGELDSANRMIMESMQISTELNDLEEVRKCWNEFGIIASEQGNLERGLLCFMKVKSMYHDAGDEIGEARMAVNIGGVNRLMGKPNTAEKYILAGLKVLEKTDDKRTIMSSYNMLSSVYMRKNEYEKALDAIEKEKQLAIELNDVYQLTSIQHNLGSYYWRMGMLDSSKIYSRKALDAYTKYGSIQGQAMTMMNIAGAEYKAGNNDSALFYAEKAVQLAEDLGIMKTVTEGYDLLMRIHQAKGSYEEALRCSQRYNKLNDSIIGAETRDRQNKLSVAFETKEKENENRLLSEQDKIKSLKIKQQTYLIAGLGVCLLLIIIIAIFYVRYRKSQAGTKQAELEQRALRAQMNPHFIFNSLNSIQRMFIEGKHDLANDYMGDFGQLLRIILENSGKSSISVKDELDTLKLYLDIEIMRTDGIIAYELNVDPSIDLLNDFVPPLVIQPFVENAIWHGILPKGEKGKINIELKRQDAELLVCTITDDGVGIEQSKKQKEQRNHNSKGMNITEERLSVMNAVKAEELKTGGTKVTVLIPINR